MHDGRDLLGRNAMTRAQLQQHRCAGRPAVVNEGRLLRNGQMHARRLDRLQRGDGARQLAFQRVLVAGALHELADAEARILVDHLEAAVLALRQSLRGKLQPRVMHALGGHHDGAAVVVDLVLDTGGLQRLHHAAGIGVGQVAVQQAPVRTAPPQHHGDAGGDREGYAEQQQQRTDVQSERAGHHDS